MDTSLSIGDWFEWYVRDVPILRSMVFDLPDCVTVILRFDDGDTGAYDRNKVVDNITCGRWRRLCSVAEHLRDAARIIELENALRPFAAIASVLTDHTGEHLLSLSTRAGYARLTRADINRARDVLAGNTSQRQR